MAGPTPLSRRRPRRPPPPPRQQLARQPSSSPPPSAESTTRTSSTARRRGRDVSRKLSYAARLSRLPSDLQQAIKRTLLARHGPALGSEIDLLRRSVLGSSNAERAARAYVALRAMQAKNPGRLAEPLVRALIDGVGRARASADAGREGLLGLRTALRAAKTVVGMARADARALASLLDEAGRVPPARARPAEVSPSTERALILKAIAARRDALLEAANKAPDAKQTSAPMDDVSAFAVISRGRPRALLLARSTVLDLDGDRQDGALQQRFTDSCVPTVGQMAHAERDPIYALSLHHEAIHSLRAGAISSEQRSTLEAHGGEAVPRTTNARGRGVPTRSAGAIVAKLSGRKLSGWHFPRSARARSKALKDAAKTLAAGGDVSVVVSYPRQSADHALFISDVRGKGGTQRFLVTDPWQGKTRWVNASAIVGGTDAWFGQLVATFR